MTIAACYVSPEGIVVGADSTSTYATSDGNHYFNHGQKIFEVGEKSTLAIATWGLGGLHTVSYRRLIADLDDSLKVSVPTTVAEVAQRWVDLFWPAYSGGAFKQVIDRCLALHAKTPFDASTGNAPGMRTQAEEEEYQRGRQGLVVGFCIGGYVLPDRSPSAYQMIFDPLGQKPAPVILPLGSYMFWGAPNMLRRLVWGYDEKITADVIASGKWTGTPDEFNNLLAKYQLQHPVVPIRDAIDFTYSCIYSTIKAFKFSNLSQICGGTIEVAVITVDRQFRWVRHKEMHSAITEGRL